MKKNLRIVLQVMDGSSSHKKATMLMLYLAMTFCAVHQIAAETYSGNCGATLSWTYDSMTESLTIHGTGPMTNYSYGSAPWFSYRSYIKKLNIDNGVTSIGDYAFDISHLTSVTIPEGVTSIGKSAFGGSGLTTLTLPGSVSSICDYAFYKTSNLTVIYANMVTPPSVNSTLFDGDDLSNCTLYVPAGSVDAYKAADVWKSFGKIMAMSSDDDLLGDVNGDGVVNITDAVEVINYVNKAASSKFIVGSADINKDGKVDTKDATAIYNVLFGEKPQTNRPEGHDITLTPITSAWNKAKTQTIVWADKGDTDASGIYCKGRFWLKGSYTDIEDYNTPDSDGCALVFRDNTNYTGCDNLKVITMPTPTEWQMAVPSYAVKQNTGLPQPSFDDLPFWYSLEYGTNLYGKEDLYGGAKPFRIAFCSPIYYDGAYYNWEKQVYEGGCSLPTEPYIIDFPCKETTITSADFVGSNDPSTSIIDPIVYFGPVAPNDNAWKQNREQFYYYKTATDLLYRDARILKTEIAMGDPSDVAPEYPDYYVWNDPTNMKLFEVAPKVTDDGIYFKTFDNQPSLQSLPAFYYNLVVTDVWGCVKTYPFVIAVKPNTPLN